MSDSDDPLHGSDLPPAVPVGDLHEGKHAAVNGPLVPPMPHPNLGDQRTGAEVAHAPTPLALQAQTIANDVRGLRKAADSLTHRTALLAAAVATAVVLAIAAFIVLYFQSVTTKQLTGQQTLINAQQHSLQVIQRRVLCPVLQLVISGDNPAARATYPGGTAAHDQLITAMLNGATALQCGAP